MLALIGLHAFVFFLAGATGLFALDRRCRTTLFILAILVGLTVGGLVATQSPHFATWMENAQLRLTTDRIERMLESPVEALAFRMDIFDGPALLFLTSNPVYLFVGAGPGLVSLPATEYMLPSVYFDWALDAGINSPPTLGVLLELSNAGLIGLMLWFIICLSLLKAFNYLAKRGKPEDRTWSVGRSAFVVVAACYLAQAAPLSAFWPVFLGSGIGAAYLVRLYRSGYENPVPSALLSRKPQLTLG